MSASPWTTPHDGIAYGPSVTHRTADGTVAVTLTLMWNDETGITIEINTQGDPLPLALAATVATSIAELSLIKPPIVALAA